MGRNPGACRSYAEVSVDGVPLCSQHSQRTLEARILAGVGPGRVVTCDTGFCEYDRVFRSWNPAAGEVWEYRVELRPPRRDDLVHSVYFLLTAESEAGATAQLRIPPGWAVYVNRVRRVSRV